MAGESWREMSTRYKDSKQPDIEEVEFKYKKKKPKKKNKKANHKHTYKDAIFHFDYTGLGLYCSQCGKIYATYVFCTQEQIEKARAAGAREFYDKGAKIFEAKYVNI